MKSIFLKLFTLSIISFAAISCQNQSDTLRIATAANMQFAMPELISVFEEETGIKADMILSSSGKLTAQIEAGAPFDLFFSADTKYPERLEAKGLSNKPQVYAYGQLVYWQKQESQNKLFAMANPKTAPYGKATQEYLNELNKTLPDVVYGESISQVNRFLLSGTVDGGYTSHSSVLSEKFSDKGHWQLIADSLHNPISQSMVMVKSSQRQEWAHLFIKFVTSARGRQILKRYGYQ